MYVWLVACVGMYYVCIRVATCMHINNDLDLTHFARHLYFYLVGHVSTFSYG